MHTHIIPFLVVSILCIIVPESHSFATYSSTKRIVRNGGLFHRNSLNHLKTSPIRQNKGPYQHFPFLAATEEASNDTNSPAKALMPAKEQSVVDEELAEISSTPSESASTVLFINQQTKRTLIEELGYKRAEVDILRPELAGPIIDKRLYRPATGIPEEWKLDESASSMLERMENESKYPAKFPLLAVSLVLLGKGLSDAIITLIKVNIDFPGASLTEEFMGVPVLAIDFLCVLVGSALGWWTWKTMKD